jgi:hypothetical protein
MDIAIAKGIHTASPRSNFDQVIENLKSAMLTGTTPVCDDTELSGDN